DSMKFIEIIVGPAHGAFGLHHADDFKHPRLGSRPAWKESLPCPRPDAFRTDIEIGFHADADIQMRLRYAACIVKIETGKFRVKYWSTVRRQSAHQRVNQLAS